MIAGKTPEEKLLAAQLTHTLLRHYDWISHWQDKAKTQKLGHIYASVAFFLEKESKKLRAELRAMQNQKEIE